MIGSVNGDGKGVFQMRKMFIAACLVVAALAAVPSLASAKPVITHPTGTVLMPVKKIKATNVGITKITTEFGNLECSTVIMEGNLTKNNKAEGTEGTIEAVDIGGTGATIVGDPEPECTGTGSMFNASVVAAGLPWCVSATGTTDTLTILGGKCGENKPTTFIVKETFFGNILTCKYEKTAGISGNLQTDVTGQDATVSIAEAEFVGEAGNSGSCPKTGKLDTTVTLETGEGTPTQLFFSSL
jgi:hypothetical protein